MQGQLAIRPRRRTRRRPIAIHGVSLAPAAASAGGPAPTLSFSSWEDTRNQRMSAIYSLGLHLAVLLGLILAAVLAPPEIMEKIIPVALVRPPEPIELPGTNAEPAPAAPKAVGARRPANAAALAAAQTVTPDQAQALRQAALEAARRALEQMEIATVQDTVLPTQIKRREVQANRVAARAAAIAVPTASIDASQIKPVTIDPSRLEALAPELEGPQEVDLGELPELSAAEAMAVLESIPPSNYRGGVAALAWEPGSGVPDVASTSSGLGSASGGGLGAGGRGEGGLGVGAGSGGTGQALGSVRCLESAHVQRYLGMVQSRTQKRWIIPAGVDPKARAVLRFGLDAAGMASGVEAVDVGDPTLGESAVRALQTAAPFPPMIDANRCLAEKRILLTFTVPRT